MRKTYYIGSKINRPDYFCVTPKNGSTEISVERTSISGLPRVINLQYSIDKEHWVNYTIGNIITSSVPVYFRGNNVIFSRIYPDGSTDQYANYGFVFNNTVDLSGQLSSLAHKYVTVSKKPLLIIFNSDYIRSVKDLVIDIDVGRVHINSQDWIDCTCARMFNTCHNLIDTPMYDLHINDVYTTEHPNGFFNDLIGHLYYKMFDNCDSLTTIGSLPPMYGCDCYEEMFNECDNLAALPKLPATTLEPECYRHMFYYCPKIKVSTTRTGDYQNEYRIPFTGTGTTATDALQSMFGNTGGSFTGTPTINTTYYTSNEVI